MWQTSFDGSPTLYLVATPIGNMEDMSSRCIQVLQNVAVVFSEDTRQTRKLFARFDIATKLLTLNLINESDIKKSVIRYLEQGLDVALVSDRGTPLISDPGYEVVNLVIANHFNVVAVGHQNALLPAVTTSGLDTNRFLFVGFLSHQTTKIIQELNDLKQEKVTLIFYESPHRIRNTLKLMLEVLGDRTVALARELTKVHESIYRGLLSDLIKDKEEIKGEIVIIVSGFSTNYIKGETEVLLEVDRYVKVGIKVMDAIKMAIIDSDYSKSDIYKLYHERRDKK